MGKKKRGADHWRGYDPDKESEQEMVDRLYKEQEEKEKKKTKAQNPERSAPSFRAGNSF